MASPQGISGFRDIKKVVLDRIRSGIWPPDSLLPGEAELAEEFSTTRTTVNRALRELAEEGYLERRRRAGTRVLRSPVRQARFKIPLARDEVEAQGSTYRYSRISLQQTEAPEWLAAKLGFGAGQPVIHVRSMHYAGSRPFQFEDRWIIAGNVPGAAEQEFLDISPGEWLVETMPFTTAELSFMAAKADRELSGFLDVPPGDPVFLAERLTRLQGKPVTFARLFHSEGYRMTTIY